MAVITIYRLAEEILKALSGGQIQSSSNVSLNEIKISIGQVVNQMLKAEHFSVNEKMGEKIPNGSVLGLYEGIAVEQWNNVSRAKLPIKPLKLPRDMGIWSVYPSGRPDKEFIPLQMGQEFLVKSQPMINDLLGQVGRTTYGGYVNFTKNIVTPDGATVDMRLVIMDVSQYDDYEILPILPEQEWDVKKQVWELYSKEEIADYLVDPSVKENQKVPPRQQQQS